MQLNDIVVKTGYYKKTMLRPGQYVIIRSAISNTIINGMEAL